MIIIVSARYPNDIIESPIVTCDPEKILIKVSLINLRSLNIKIF